MLTLKTTELYDLSHTLSAPLLGECEYPWLALPKIKDFVRALGKTLPADEYDSPIEDVWISKRATVARSAVICGPAIIGHDTEVRTGAYSRSGLGGQRMRSRKFL